MENGDTYQLGKILGSPQEIAEGDSSLTSDELERQIEGLCVVRGTMLKNRRK